MQWLTLKRLLRAERGMRKADLYGQIAAIHKAQAVIEFDLDGHVLMANQNFLDTMGYELDEVIGQHHRIFVLPDERESADYLAFWERLGQGRMTQGVIAAFARMAATSGCRPATTRFSTGMAGHSK